MKRLRGASRVIAASIGASLAFPAAADSDGTFCVGQRYVAYELRPWSSASGGHVVHIVRVGGRTGISVSAPVFLDDFQVHAMTCADDHVVVRGWESRYVIALDPPAISAVEAVPAANTAAEDGLPRTAFEHGRGRRLVIPAPGDAHTYEMRIAYREEPHTTPGQGGIIYHFYVASVIERSAGAVAKRRELYRGVREETID